MHSTFSFADGNLILFAWLVTILSNPTSLTFSIPVHIPTCHNREGPALLRILFICGLILSESMILASLLSALICVINYVRSLDYVILLKYVVSMFVSRCLRRTFQGSRPMSRSRRSPFDTNLEGCFLIFSFNSIDFSKFYVPRSRSILSVRSRLMRKRTLVLDVLDATSQNRQCSINSTHLVYHIFKSVFLNSVSFRMKTSESPPSTKNSSTVNIYNMTYFIIKTERMFRYVNVFIHF